MRREKKGTILKRKIKARRRREVMEDEGREMNLKMMVLVTMKKCEKNENTCNTAFITVMTTTSSTTTVSTVTTFTASTKAATT